MKGLRSQAREGREGGAVAWGTRRVVLCAVMVAAVAAGGGGAARGDDGFAGPPVAASREGAPLGRPAVAGGTGSKDGSGPGAAGGGQSLGLARTVLALGFVVGLALLGGAVVRRVARSKGGLIGAIGAGGAAPAGLLEIIGRYPVGRGQRLVLLRVDRRVLLLSHVAPSRLSRGGGFTTLCEIKDADDVASILTKARDAEGESLAAKFQSMLTRYGAAGAAEGEDGDEEVEAGRRVAVGREGDRTELWDDRHVGPGPVAGGANAGRKLTLAGGAEGKEDAVSAIRRRLEAMRMGAGGGS